MPPRLPRSHAKGGLPGPAIDYHIVLEPAVRGIKRACRRTQQARRDNRAAATDQPPWIGKVCAPLPAGFGAGSAGVLGAGPPGPQR